MKSLYLRIWLTVVAALALFALVSGWMWQRHLDEERARFESAAGERIAAWAELVHRALPAADAPVAEQAQALLDWSARLRVPLALDDPRGRRVAASESFERREAEGLATAVAVRLDDGRTLWLARRGPRRPGPGSESSDEPRAWRGIGGDVLVRRGSPVALPIGFTPAVGPLLLVAVLFVAVAAGAYPVVRRLTRRLEALERGVEAFGGGDLSQRVDATGRDEVAAVAATFNRAAARIQTLVRSHQTLLANASHELRSPLARLKMAVTMVCDVPPAQRAPLQREIDTNIAELDALVEEVLLASRLEADSALARDDQVDLLGLAAEEAARVGAEVEAGVGTPAMIVQGSERLLRRALRNLLENARRYGGDEVQVDVAPGTDGRVQLRVCDRGPGVPEALRERIFEPFFRLPGHAEREGGVGLGLSLVRQIAEWHRGSVRCEARDGGGSCFVLSLPAQ